MKNQSNLNECLSANYESNIKIGIAQTDEEKIKIYQFRYHVYIEEMHKRPKLKDPKSKLLFDEMDKWALLLHAKVGTELIGTMRVNIGEIKQFPKEIIQSLSLEKFKKFYSDSERPQFALTTKLMISKDYRNSAVFHLLTAKGYELYCNHHVLFNFGGCNFYLLRLYEQMGCYRFGRNFIDPGYGLLAPIVLLVEDVNHFKAVRSPFYRIARKQTGLNSNLKEWFLKEFPECGKVVNSHLVSKDELWQHIVNYVHSAPEAVIPVLQGLSKTEACSFFYRCSVIVQCQPGDQVITTGLVSEELNILLYGELVIEQSSLINKKKVLPGQHFGSVGLTKPVIQYVDIVANTPAVIAVISKQYFRKFSVAYPEIAKVILQNLQMQNS